MTEAERLGEAKALSANRLFWSLLAELERQAIDACVNTNDDHIRHARALELWVFRCVGYDFSFIFI